MAKAMIQIEIDDLTFGDYRFHAVLFSGDDLTQLLQKDIVLTIPGSAPQPTSIKDPIVTITE